MRFTPAKFRQLLVAVAGIILSGTAFAEKYDVEVWNSGTTAKPVEQEAPAYPENLAKTGQEGWVRMHFVVTPDGAAIDPIVIDSSGGIDFEAEARKAAAAWRFTAPATAAEDAHNLVNIRSAVRGSRDSATKSFRRQFERIVTDLYHEENEKARTGMDDLYNSGGFNLYESTMLWLMMGRVEGAEGDEVGKLECYRRALGVSSTKSLRIEGKLDLLSKIFVLEHQFGQYAAAMRTFQTLKTASGENPVDETLANRALEIQGLMDSAEPLVAQAAVYNPCDCEAGEPLWYYKPARRTFSFANLSGNVTRFEARCENQRIQGLVEVDRQWSLAPEWGSCRIFVFGDDGATFEFIEHPSDAEEDAPNAVASDDVLDRRNRGQRS